MIKYLLCFLLLKSCVKPKEIEAKNEINLPLNFPFGFIVEKIKVNKPTNILLCPTEMQTEPVYLVKNSKIPIGVMEKTDTCYYLNSVVFENTGKTKISAVVQGELYEENLEVYAK